MLPDRVDLPGQHAAIVGGGRLPVAPPNELRLWDDRRAQVLATLEFPAAVVAVARRAGLHVERDGSELTVVISDER